MNYGQYLVQKMDEISSRLDRLDRGLSELSKKIESVTGQEEWMSQEVKGRNVPTELRYTEMVYDILTSPTKKTRKKLSLADAAGLISSWTPRIRAYKRGGARVASLYLELKKTDSVMVCLTFNEGRDYLWVSRISARVTMRSVSNEEALSLLPSSVADALKGNWDRARDRW